MVNSFVDRLLVWIFGLNWEELAYGSAVLSDLDEKETKVEKKQDRRLFLKIKLKNLRDEVALIKSHEERLKNHIAVHMGMSEHLKSLVDQMVHHRKFDIRNETRATLLAYGYIRGRNYHQLECTTRPESCFAVKARVERVARMVNKYSVMDWNPEGLDVTMENVRAWMSVDKDGHRVLHNQVVEPVAVAAQ